MWLCDLCMVVVGSLMIWVCGSLLVSIILMCIVGVLIFVCVWLCIRVRFIGVCLSYWLYWL